MRSKYYDVVFLGGEIGGLLSAVSLLKKGVKVLVFDTEDYFYPFKKNDAFSSQVTYFGGFTLRNLLKSLGFHPLEINKLKAVDPSLQVIMPGIRFDLYSDEKKLLGELKREFPDIWGEANGFFAKMTSWQDLYPKIFLSGVKFPPETFIERYKFKKFSKKLSPLAPLDLAPLSELVGSLNKNKEFVLLLKAIVTAVSDLSSLSYSLPYLSQIVNTARFEGYEFEGGLRNFHDVLVEKVKERGGIVFNEGDIEGVSVAGRYIDSINLTGCSVDKLVLSHLVLNGNPQKLLSLLPSSRKNFILKKRLSRITPKYLKYTYYMKMKSIVYPEGMRERVILISDRNAELSDDNFLYISKIEDGKDQTTISVSAFLKPDLLNNAEELQRFTKKCTEKISGLIPFLEENLLGIETPKIKKTNDFQSDLKSRFVYETENPSYFGITALPYTSFLKNLFFLGQSIYPGLGFDGEVQAGLKVSRHISDVFKIKRP